MIIRDTLLIFRRQVRLSLRNPVWVVLGLIQPVMYLAFFGPLLIGVRPARGFPEGSSWQVYVPGLLLQLGLFGALFVGFSIVGEVRAGVIERMRVTPVSRLSLLLGRVLRDVVVLLIQSIVLIAAGFFFGLRAPLLGIVVALGFVALLAVTMSSFSYSMGLILKSEDALAPSLNALAVPAMLLSGILLPMSMAPAWLRTVSAFNPMRHVVDGMREVFLGHFTTAPVLYGTIAAVGMAIAAVTMGVRVFQRENA